MQHLRSARDQSALHASVWMRGILIDGGRPEIVLLEELDSFEEADEAERFWIEYFRSLGCRLVNRAIGGSARAGWSHSFETRERWRRECCGENAPRYGQAKSPEERANISAAVKAAWASGVPHPQKGRKKTPEEIDRIKAGVARNPPKLTDEGRSRKARWSSERWTPEYREHFKKLTSGDRNPNFGKPLADHVQAAAKIANARRKGEKRSPETRERMRQAMLERYRRLRAQ